jgi:hypothetical protein
MFDAVSRVPQTFAAGRPAARLMLARALLQRVLEGGEGLLEARGVPDSRSPSLCSAMPRLFWVDAQPSGPCLRVYSCSAFW